MIEKVTVAARFGRIQEYWQPKIIGALNDSDIKAVKFKDSRGWQLCYSASGRRLTIYRSLVTQFLIYWRNRDLPAQLIVSVLNADRSPR
jgi:hypothetical protein